MCNLHLPWELHPNDQDKLSLQLRGSTLRSIVDCSNPLIECEQLIILQEMICILCATPNAPKSCTMQVIWTK